MVGPRWKAPRPSHHRWVSSAFHNRKRGFARGGRPRRRPCSMMAPHSPVIDAEDPLAGAALFNGLTETQRARIATLVVHRDVEPGTVLVREGDPAGELLVIQQGSVDVTKRVAGAEHEQRIATLEAGATLGEMTLLDRAPRSATVRATTRARVGILSMD